MTGSISISERPALTSRYLFFYASVFIILVFPVFIDLINGFMIMILRQDISVGVLYRGSLTALMVIFYFFIRHRILQLFIILVFFLWVPCNFVWWKFGIKYELAHEMNQLFRMSFIYMVLSYFVFLVERFEVDIELMMKCLVAFALIAAFALIFSFLTGVGVNTYREYGFGSSSFFKAQNDIGLAILLTYPMTMYFLLRNFSAINFGISVTILASLFILSTRAGTLGSLGVFVLFFGAMFLYGRQYVKMSTFFKVCLFLITIIVLVVGLYQYLLFVAQYPYMVKKYVLFFEGRTRENLLELGAVRLQQRPFILDLFGEGDLSFHYYIFFLRYSIVGQSNQGKDIESDLMDMIGSYGYLLGGLLLLFPTFLLFKMIYHFIRKRSLLNLTFLTSIALYVFHAMAAGHAIASPTVATSAVVVYLYILKYNSFQPLADRKLMRNRYNSS